MSLGAKNARNVIDDDYADGFGDTTTPFGQIILNGSATGQLEQIGDRDWFQIHLAAGRAYTVFLDGQQTGVGSLEDPFLRIYDSAGTLIAENDDVVVESNRDSQVTFEAIADGIFYLEAAAYHDMYTGSYRVRVSGTAVDDFADNLTDTTAPFGDLATNGASIGSLEQVGDRDWFHVTLTAGLTYNIDLMGTQGGGGSLEDPHLRLYDHNGSKIAENDDVISGANRDSQLTFQVSTTGTYYIEAGAFGDIYVGTYLVSLNVVPTQRFEGPQLELATFGPSAGWSSDDAYPRELGDVNGDGMADIVGFGPNGVYVSLASGAGDLANPSLRLASFGAGAGGWSSDNTYPRELADVNGDGCDDIVGFGSAGVYVSLATGSGNFAGPSLVLASFGAAAGGWSSDDLYTRHLGDVNGDGMEDIIGFGSAGVWVSLATGGGNFAGPALELASFGSAAGGWSSDGIYPRHMADVNGDGRDDIVGFGSAGVWVSLATGGGHFGGPFMALASFGAAAGGWSSDNSYPRVLADINGDGRADIVGFGESQVYYALGQADGTFGGVTADLASFGISAGGWISNDTLLRLVDDVTGDGRGDIVGFGTSGVYVSRAVDFVAV